MDRLAAIAKKSRRLVAGILSGTSADAIDCAICSIEGFGPPRDVETGEARTPARVKLEAFCSQPYDPALREKLLHPPEGARELALLHAETGDAFAGALLRTLIINGIPEEAIDLAGSHGQTIYHHSGRPPKVTLQIGDGDRIAERCGFVVISDFRARDVAAGGEGAPLTPYADLILYANGGGPRAILNLGGIGNITILADDPREVVAFDTGPANAPLDRLARILTNGEMLCDRGGAIAARGKINEALLDELLHHPFITKKPPKSTGTETFGDEFVKLLMERAGATADLQATLTMFSAKSVARSIQQFAPPAFINNPRAQIVVSGGGGRNKTLMARLAECVAPAQVVSSDALGVPSHAREAMAFAILANDALAGLATNLPSVTGAHRGVTLGKLSFPDRRRSPREC